MIQTGGRLKPFDYLLYALVVFAWGTSWIGIHIQVAAPVAPEVSVFWRFVLAGCVMALLALLRGENLLLPLRAHRLLVPMGLALFCTNFLLFYLAALSLPSGLLSVILSMAAIINPGLAALIFGQKLDTRTVIGAVLGVIGVALLFWPQFAGASFDRAALVGLLLGLAGTLSFCLGNMASAASQRAGIPVLAGTAWGMFYGVCWIGAWCLLRGYSFRPVFTVSYLGSLVFVALSASVLAFSAYLTLLGRIGAARAGYATVMFPVVALLISTFAENYAWSLAAVAGLVLALGGNVLVMKR